MMRLKWKFLLSIPTMLLVTSAQAFEPKLYNSYSVDNAMTTVSFTTCGSTVNTTGCYGFGSMGPFRKACAIVATPTRTQVEANNTTTLLRRVAIMDRGSALTDQVTLSIYQERINFNANSARSSVTLVRSLNLPLKGGPTASCSLARAGSFFYVGTNQSPRAVRIDSRFSVAEIGGFSSEEPVVNISTTADGNVAVTHSGGYYLFQKDGSLLQVGGGADFVVGSADSVHLGPNAPYIPGFLTSAAPQNAQSLPMFVNGQATIRSGSGEIIFDGARTFAR